MYPVESFAVFWATMVWIASVCIWRIGLTRAHIYPSVWSAIWSFAMIGGLIILGALASTFSGSMALPIANAGMDLAIGMMLVSHSFVTHPRTT